jgi:PAS domain S-box-containing protein
MTWFIGVMNDTAQSTTRVVWAWWAVVMSLLCTFFLWYSAYLVALHASELHKIINYSADAVVVCGPTGDVLYANDALLTITGFSEDDLRTDGVKLLIPDFMRAAHRAGVERAKLKSARGIEGVNYRAVYPVLHKNGKFILCRVSVGTVRHFGAPQFFAFITPLAAPSADPEKPTQLPQEKASDWTATLHAEIPR